MQESLGQRIRKLRKERNLSQTDLGNLVGVTISWISTIEQDRAMPSAELVSKLADALKIPVRELLQNEEQHMEIVSRIKLIEVLIEKHRAADAEEIINGLLDQTDLSETQKHTLSIHQAEIRLQQKRFDEAHNILRPLIEHLEALNYHDAYIMAWIYNILGSVQYSKQKYYEAHANYTRANILINRFVDFDLLAAKISYNVALALLRLDKSQEAIPYLQAAERYYEQTNALTKLADTLFTRGIAYKNAKDYVKASECFDQTKAILNVIDHDRLSVIVQHTVATEITVRENPTQALSELEICLNKVRDLKDHPRQILVHAKIAYVQMELNNFQNASTHIEQAENLISDHAVQDTPEVAEFFRIKSIYYFRTNNYTQSVKCAYYAAAEFDKMQLRKDKARSLQVAILSYKAMGEFEKALTLALECNPYFN
ncbi:hypothetical protein CBW65_23620 [Tumebacillus avium]|uniref:HTH cro/C1-type domain-containing protein n=1 Tax=Tumebacillus avium TaxID=1903704 RepID=A0A1Y0IWF6_9BACL|nr:helix-turn-helix domain-containing protein [Tumebacillus avium]ARU63674.1 hypothetical protein CBW65_23620 [Tumebacillus avium]